MASRRGRAGYKSLRVELVGELVEAHRVDPRSQGAAECFDAERSCARTSMPGCRQAAAQDGVHHLFERQPPAVCQLVQFGCDIVIEGQRRTHDNIMMSSLEGVKMSLDIPAGARTEEAVVGVWEA
jgi:hypothetical protein